MDISPLTKVITEFRAITARNTISPESLGYLLQQIADKVAKAVEAPEEVEQIKQLAQEIDSFAQEVATVKTIANSNKTAIANLQKGIKDIGHYASLDAACSYAARSEISGDRNIYMIKFTYTGSAGTVGSFIIQSVKGDNISMQYLFDKCEVKRRNVTGATGMAGGTVNAYAWGETFPHSIAYDASARKLTLKSYENVEVNSVVLPLATTSASGLMSNAEKSKLSALPTKAALDESLATKVDAEANKGLSSYDFDITYKSTLQNLVDFGVAYFFDVYDTLYNGAVPPMGVGEGGQLVYCSRIKRFLLLKDGTYYGAWNADGNGHGITSNVPKSGRLYICGSDIYAWNGTDMVQIGGTLASATYTPASRLITLKNSRGGTICAITLPEVSTAQSGLMTAANLNKLSEVAALQTCTCFFHHIIYHEPELLFASAGSDFEIVYCVPTKKFYAKDSAGIYYCGFRGDTAFGTSTQSGTIPYDKWYYVNLADSYVYSFANGDVSKIYKCPSLKQTPVFTLYSAKPSTLTEKEYHNNVLANPIVPLDTSDVRYDPAQNVFYLISRYNTMISISDDVIFLNWPGCEAYGTETDKGIKPYPGTQYLRRSNYSLYYATDTKLEPLTNSQ